jgi:hypothetical protein
LLQEQAIIYSAELGLDDFTASNGWLQSFQKRHGIRSAMLSGEAAEVSMATVEDWKKRLSTICEGYEEKDIFNADETGLFYRTVPSRSLVQKGDSRHGGKLAKERITVMTVCSAAGEKLQLLVIGKPEHYQSHAKPTVEPG